MSDTTLQVRDVPEGVLTRLRERAKARGVSLSAYVRELLSDEAQTSGIRVKITVEMTGCLM